MIHPFSTSSASNNCQLMNTSTALLCKKRQLSNLPATAVYFVAAARTTQFIMAFKRVVQMRL
jgi:hypothetical protein